MVVFKLKIVIKHVIINSNKTKLIIVVNKRGKLDRMDFQEVNYVETQGTLL